MKGIDPMVLLDSYHKYRRWKATITPIAVAAFLFPAALSLMAQSDVPLEKGAVINKVSVRKDPGQSYALYLPSKYSPDKEWPVLYCFDPAARGHIPVERFRQIAERLGYIVIGSNVSRNSLSRKEKVDSVQDLWEDTHQRLAINRERTYACGMSGGARLASYLASSCNGCVKGVIANAAGFMGDAKPTPQLPFVFFGTAGVDDFNYPELRVLSDKLTELG